MRNVTDALLKKAKSVSKLKISNNATRQADDISLYRLMSRHNKLVNLNYTKWSSMEQGMTEIFANTLSRFKNLKNLRVMLLKSSKKIEETIIGLPKLQRLLFDVIDSEQNERAGLKMLYALKKLTMIHLAVAHNHRLDITQFENLANLSIQIKKTQRLIWEPSQKTFSNLKSLKLMLSN